MSCKMSHVSIDEKTRKEQDFPEDLMWLCVGIEDPDDLIDDLKTALVKAGAVTIGLDGSRGSPALVKNRFRVKHQQTLSEAFFAS